MNGSYYQTPVFINDIERDTNNPIVDNFNVRTTASMPGYTTYFRYPDTINNPEYKHFITPKKIADHIKWLEAFTKERLSQIAKNFNCFKNNDKVD